MHADLFFQSTLPESPFQIGLNYPQKIDNIRIIWTNYWENQVPTNLVSF